MIAGHSIRETVEAMAVALILALLFRGFEAEAFVIPTGSMAPTLMGQHKDLCCSQCGYWYQAGASSESEELAQQQGRAGQVEDVVWTTCPICRYVESVDPRTESGREHATFGGDRVLVSKFSYELGEPRRWDVAVFRFPGEAQVNYIKRLVGLPRERVRIWHGDLYVEPEGDDTFRLERRSAAKVRSMAQIVYDNDYVVGTMTEKGWPLRWQNWPATDAGKDAWASTDGGRSFAITASAELQWLRYRHYVPTIAQWGRMKQARLPEGYEPRPQLITDFYAYDTSVARNYPEAQPQLLGREWVGDLLLECRLEVKSAAGTVLFDLVKGGRHFRCELDCQSGQARLAIDGVDAYAPSAQTSVRGPGSHEVAFANVDEQLLLWIDGSEVAFDGPTTYEPLGNDRPQSNSQDAGDLAPAGVAAQSAALRVSQLRLRRDIYYIAATEGPVTDYPPSASVPRMNYWELVDFLSTPAAWNPSGQASPFDARREVIFPLGADEFLALGDNSPASQDARLWDAEKFVRRDLLIGKALYVFWPHALDKLPGTKIPFPFFPNFARMRLIR